GSVARCTLVTHAIERGPGRVARGCEPGAAGLGAPVAEERRSGGPRAQRVNQDRHLPAAVHEGPEPRETREEARGWPGRRARTEPPVGAPGGLEVLAHPVAEHAVEVEGQDRGRGHARGL